MALIEMNFFSNSLKRTVTVNVVIPTDKRTFLGEKPREKEYPVLYLLHGIFGNYTDWVCGTTLMKLADAYDLCVVTPSGDNKFYCDSTKSGDMYGTFIAEELPQIIEATFPVSKKREDTFLAGLSMGGFGACVNGLRHPEKFGYLGLFSAGINKEGILNSTNDPGQIFCTRKMYETMFDLDDIKEYDGSVNDPEFLAEDNVKKGLQLPKIWMACGTEDFLVKPNDKFAALLEKLGYDLTYLKWGGGHDWVFWEECINKFIPWLPLKKETAGISSGHVRQDEE